MPPSNSFDSLANGQLGVRGRAESEYFPQQDAEGPRVASTGEHVVIKGFGRKPLDKDEYI